MTKQKKARRARGSGSIYRKGSYWWVAYRGLDGKRHAESSYSDRKGDAERLLRTKVAAIDRGIPMTPQVDKLTFAEAAKAVLQDYRNHGRRSLLDAERRITKHLLPFLGQRRLASIDTAAVRAYVAHRQAQGIVAVKGPRTGERVADVSAGEVNRELTLLKRAFSLAMQDGRILHRPHVPMLAERNTRTGFFEAAQFASLVSHLPPAIRPAVEFAYITGWRVASEVLPLQWRQVDFSAGEVRLDPHTTKNDEGRTFPFTDALRRLLEGRQAERDRLKLAGHIMPFVFFRLVAAGRGGEKRPKRITAFGKAWKTACRAAACPGRIPHDLRRTAVRNLVRAGIPERVAMTLTGHKTRSVFERYNIVSAGDLVDAARRLNVAAAAARGAAGS